MKANEKFSSEDTRFWGYVKLISERCGYSKKSKGVLVHSSKKILKELNKLGIEISTSKLEKVMDYIQYRADILNDFVEDHLMDKDEAKQLFKKYIEIYKSEELSCSIPMNKQKNEKREPAFFTSIINIITERSLMEAFEKYNIDYDYDEYLFDDDPRRLTYFTSPNDKIVGTLSRRFDGAFPSTVNPLALWEIKEYYYTTTFGSRIADGVYETQLDGFEVNEISEVLRNDCKHYYFIDAYHTWWNMGRSYLCRIIDALHQGLVDEVIFGREVVTRLPELIDELVKENKKILRDRF